jgi:hypothetical protein
MNSSFQTFETHYQSIKNLIRTADIYTNLSFARLQGRDMDSEHINKLLDNKQSMSLMVNAWEFHMSEEENSKLRSDPHIKALCEQIVMTTYVSIEYYLVNRFKELISERIPDKRIASSLLKNTNGTSLEKLKRNYNDFLGINIPDFRPDIAFQDSNWFTPKDSWGALILMSEVRKEVAHTGTSSKHDITFLEDAYSPFYFTWRWVGLFHSLTLKSKPSPSNNQQAKIN